VETAIILPLLVTLTFGACEYGWLLLKAQQISNAARHGARMAAVADGTSESATVAVDSLMASAGLDGTGYTVTITPTDVAGMEAGEVLNVQVVVPTSTLVLTGMPLPIPTNLQSSVSMAKEAQ